MKRRVELRAVWLFIGAMARRFRWTLVALAGAVALGTVLYIITPHAQLGGHRPPLTIAMFGAWMALFAQPILTPPETWYLAVLSALYPLVGFVLIGEGILR